MGGRVWMQKAIVLRHRSERMIPRTRIPAVLTE